MRRLLALLIVGSPALALAQPAPPPSAPPPPPGDGTGQPPYDPNAGSPPPYSQPPPSSGPYGGPNYGPGQNTQPYGAQPYPQQQMQPQPTTLRSGMTFEASLGVGWMRITDNDSDDSLTSDLGAGIGLGVGGWVSPQLAITGRISGTSTTFDEFSSGGESIRYNQYFVGGAVQYWVDDHFWFGGGAGIAVLAASFMGESDSINGFGFQGRAGYSFSTGSENTFNVQLELTPGFYSEDNGGGTVTGVGIMVGYQHL